MKKCLYSLLLTSLVSGLAHANDTLTVTTFTGPWEIAERACFIEPFSELTGTQVNVEPGVSSVTLTKLRQGGKASGIDVAWMNGGDSERAWQEGLLSPIEVDKTPNLANISDRAVYKIEEQIYAVGTGYFALTLLYNKEQISTPPDSWWALWDKDYSDRAFSLGPAGSLFIPMLMLLTDELGGTNQDFSPVINRFADLNPAIYYSSTGVVQSAIQSGEVALGAYYSNTAWTLIDADVPVRISTPKEGLPAADQRLHIVESSSNKELAQQFINYSLSETALNCIAEQMYVGPPLLKPTLSDRARERMPWGPEGSLNDLYIPDWLEVNEVRQTVTNQWNRRVVN